ncbi:hypothetical protein LCGC14_2171170, partial [marine sediment metagenome]
MTWAEEYLAAAQVFDFDRDPDDYRVTRQSEVSIAGLLVPVGLMDSSRLDALFEEYKGAFRFFRQAPEGRWLGPLTATMQVMLRRGAARAKGEPDFSYISLDPRDYTTFSDPEIGDLTVIRINT